MDTNLEEETSIKPTIEILLVRQKGVLKKLGCLFF